MGSNLEHYVREAKNGNRKAFETVVLGIQDNIFGLALRMLGRPEDAEDETQEILIKVITHLSDFREESAFTSWVYRIACNHLLTTRRRNNERDGVTFEFLEELFTGDIQFNSTPVRSGPEQILLAEEARLGCMQTMLACLDKEMRIAFILGDIFGATSKEGAYILDITPETFRKRLSRGRRRLHEFMMRHCGLVNENNKCRCGRVSGEALEPEWDGAERKSFIKKEGLAQRRAEALAHLRELSEIDRTTAMFRQYPEYHAPESFTYIIKDLIASGKYKIFTE